MNLYAWTLSDVLFYVCAFRWTHSFRQPGASWVWSSPSCHALTSSIERWHPLTWTLYWQAAWTYIRKYRKSLEILLSRYICKHHSTLTLANMYLLFLARSRYTAAPVFISSYVLQGMVNIFASFFLLSIKKVSSELVSVCDFELKSLLKLKGVSCWTDCHWSTFTRSNRRL